MNTHPYLKNGIVVFCIICLIMSITPCVSLSCDNMRAIRNAETPPYVVSDDTPIPFSYHAADITGLPNDVLFIDEFDPRIRNYLCAGILICIRDNESGKLDVENELRPQFLSGLEVSNGAIDVAVRYLEEVRGIIKASDLPVTIFSIDKKKAKVLLGDKNIIGMLGDLRESREKVDAAEQSMEEVEAVKGGTAFEGSTWKWVRALGVSKLGNTPSAMRENIQEEIKKQERLEKAIRMAAILKEINSEEEGSRVGQLVVKNIQNSPFVAEAGISCSSEEIRDEVGRMLENDIIAIENEEERRKEKTSYIVEDENAASGLTFGIEAAREAILELREKRIGEAAEWSGITEGLISREQLIEGLIRLTSARQIKLAGTKQRAYSNNLFLTGRLADRLAESKKNEKKGLPDGGSIVSHEERVAVTATNSSLSQVDFEGDAALLQIYEEVMKASEITDSGRTEGVTAGEKEKILLARPLFNYLILRNSYESSRLGKALSILEHGHGDIFAEAAPRSFDAMIEHLGEFREDGVAFIYIGFLERKDGKPFPIGEAIEVLTKEQAVLTSTSFCTGQYSKKQGWVTDAEMQLPNKSNLADDVLAKAELPTRDGLAHNI